MPTARTQIAKSSKPSKSKTAKAAKAAKTAPAPAVRMGLAEVMKVLEKAGTAQAKKTYLRHGASEPVFGVSFATLAVLMKQIRVDHALALQLWNTGNFDARNLAFKIADPAQLAPAHLDRWAKDTTVAMCALYPSMLGCEGPAGHATAQRWLASPDEKLRCSGWGLVGQLAARDETIADFWFAERLAEIEKTIHSVPNERRGPMNAAVIAIGGRSQALRKAALAAAKRIGTLDIDHGDTACETPDAAEYIEKTWARAKDKGFDSPAAQERNRESPRTRC